MESSEQHKKEVPYSGCVLLIILLMVGFIILPYMVPHPRKAREAEVRANTHVIQIALERYFTDQGHYPPYLLGGDVDGWQAWHAKWDGVNILDAGDEMTISNADVVDPLIEEDYLVSYSFNPFVSDGRGMIRLTSTPQSSKFGDGDPRFGYKGNTMGMILDDPNFFAYRPGRAGDWSRVETRRTLDHGSFMSVPESYRNADYGLYYLSGGFRDPDNPGEIIYTFMPGNFFYRAAPDLDRSKEGFTLPYPNSGIDGVYKHYILGAYGSEGRIGQDVIRLESTDPDGNLLEWRIPAEYGVGPIYCGYGDFIRGRGGLPEVFGGGDEKTGPFWPYDQISTDPEDEWIYGAPDGVPDGVITVLTDGSEVER